MKAKSVVLEHRKINGHKFNLIVKCFCADITASQTAYITGINRNTANRYFHLFRERIIEAALVDRAVYSIGNGIEADESYFGPKRVRGKRGRGAGRKIIVLGLLKRDGRVFTQIIPKANQVEIIPIIRKVVKSGSDIYTDGWRSYNALAVYGYNHKKVIHEKNEFVNGDSHINGIESFWSWAKARLHKFHGVPKRIFGLYLLESEWRFNNRENLEESLRKLDL